MLFVFLHTKNILIFSVILVFMYVCVCVCSQVYVMQMLSIFLYCFQPF